MSTSSSVGSFNNHKIRFPSRGNHANENLSSSPERTPSPGSANAVTSTDLRQELSDLQSEKAILNYKVSALRMQMQTLCQKIINCKDRIQFLDVKIDVVESTIQENIELNKNEKDSEQLSKKEDQKRKKISPKHEDKENIPERLTAHLGRHQDNLNFSSYRGTNRQR